MIAFFLTSLTAETKMTTGVCMPYLFLSTGWTRMLHLLALHRQANSIGGDESQTSPTRHLGGRAFMADLGPDNLLARHCFCPTGCSEV